MLALHLPPNPIAFSLSMPPREHLSSSAAGQIPWVYSYDCPLSLPTHKPDVCTQPYPPSSFQMNTFHLYRSFLCFVYFTIYFRFRSYSPIPKTSTPIPTGSMSRPNSTQLYSTCLPSYSYSGTLKGHSNSISIAPNLWVISTGRVVVVKAHFPCIKVTAPLESIDLS